MDEFLKWLSGMLSNNPRGNEKGTHDNPVQLPTMNARPAGAPGNPPLLDEVLRSPFAVDTLMQILRVNPNIIMRSDLHPAIEAQVETERPNEIQFNRKPTSLMDKSEIERTLAHEMSHSSHLQDKMGLTPLDMLMIFNRAYANPYERNPDSVSLRPVEGFENPLSRRPNRSMPNNFEHLAYTFEAALDAVRHKNIVDPRIWEGTVDQMDQTNPGVRVMTDFILNRLDGKKKN